MSENTRLFRCHYCSAVYHEESKKLDHEENFCWRRKESEKIARLRQIPSIKKYKILYCSSHGGFGISTLLAELYHSRFPDRKVKGEGRSDEEVIKLVEELGYDRSSNKYCKIRLEEVLYDPLIPTKYIEQSTTYREYDGLESVYVDTNNMLTKMIKDRIFTTVDQIYEMMNTIENNIIAYTLPDPVDEEFPIDPTHGGDLHQTTENREKIRERIRIRRQGMTETMVTAV